MSLGAQSLADGASGVFLHTMVIVIFLSRTNGQHVELTCSLLRSHRSSQVTSSVLNLK